MKKLILLLVIAGGIWFWWNNNQEVGTPTEEPTQNYTIHHHETATKETTEPITQTVELTRSTDIIDAFFYNQLDEEARIIYRAIRDGVADGLEEVILETDNIDLIHSTYRFVLFDHPEFFWATGAASTIVTSWTDGRTYATFKPVYAHQGADKTRMQEEIEIAIDAFLATVDPHLSEYEKVRLVYEYLILNTSYNLDAPDHQNIYSVFVNRESVCAGISRAAQLLLTRLGIFATYITGDAYVPGTSEAPVAHAWNLVRVNGKYYYLDVTWGIPFFQEDNALTIDIIYDYLLITGDLLFRTHTLGEEITTQGIILPATNSWTHTFFYLNNMFYDHNDRAVLLEDMNNSILNQERRISFQFATPELFEEMRAIIIEELAPIAAHNLMEWHGLMSTQYFFRERENLNKITIYWTYE